MPFMGICKPITGGFISFFKTAGIVKNNEEVDLQGQVLSISVAIVTRQFYTSWESGPCGYEPK